MNRVIQEVQDSLQTELTELDGRAKQLKKEFMQELKSIEEGRTRISRALVALGAQVTRSKQRKASCTRDEVTAVVQAVLTENDAVPLADLQELAKGKITAQGKSLIGFGLRMKEVLRSGVVQEVRPGVFSLAQGTDVNV